MKEHSHDKDQKLNHNQFNNENRSVNATDIPDNAEKGAGIHSDTNDFSGMNPLQRQAAMQQLANNSPQVQKGKAIQAMIDQSPRMVAQRKTNEQVFSGRSSVPDLEQSAETEAQETTQVTDTAASQKNPSTGGIKDAEGKPITLIPKPEGGYELSGVFVSKGPNGETIDMTRQKQFYESMLQTESGTIALKRLMGLKKDVSVVFEKLEKEHAFTSNSKDNITIHMSSPSEDFQDYNQQMFDNIVGTHEVLGHIGENGEELDADHETNTGNTNFLFRSPAMEAELRNSVEYYLKNGIDLSKHPTKRYEYYMAPDTDEADQITDEQRANFKIAFDKIVEETRIKFNIPATSGNE